MIAHRSSTQPAPDVHVGRGMLPSGDFAARSRVSRVVEDPDEALGSGAAARTPGRGGNFSGRECGLAADGGDDDDDDDKGGSGKGHGGMPVQDGVPLPWPARNREGKRNMVANAFWHGYAKIPPPPPPAPPPAPPLPVHESTSSSPSILSLYFASLSLFLAILAPAHHFSCLDIPTRISCDANAHTRHG